MIKILKYGEVKNNEVFSRVVPSVNVEDIVADIIKNVRVFIHLIKTHFVLLNLKTTSLNHFLYL